MKPRAPFSGFAARLMPGLCALCLLFALCPPATAADAPGGREQMANAIRQILRDDPNIVLDVLREHSEIVLDIAQQGSNQRRMKVLTTQWKRELDTTRSVALGNRPVRGDAKAPVLIAAFSDFTCPYCAQAAQTISDLMRDNPDKIRLVFKHFPLAGHQSANLAAEYHVAATFQSPEKAWVLHDLLFRQSARLNEEGETLIRRVAEEAGLNMKRLAADLRNNAARIRSIIEQDAADARQLGLQGTPNFLVNNLLVRGALAPELFGQAVTMAYEHGRNRAAR
jgi:protein-disulfide isomerase